MSWQLECADGLQCCALQQYKAIPLSVCVRARMCVCSRARVCMYVCVCVSEAGRPTHHSGSPIHLLSVCSFDLPTIVQEMPYLVDSASLVNLFLKVLYSSSYYFSWMQYNCAKGSSARSFHLCDTRTYREASIVLLITWNHL